MYNNPEIAELFDEETIHVLDYDFEYDKHIDTEKFPEYNNRVWSKRIYIWIEICSEDD